MNYRIYACTHPRMNTHTCTHKYTRTQVAYKYILYAHTCISTVYNYVLIDS